MGILLSFKNLCKSYSENIIFKNINAEIEDGDRVAIIGKSGSGKSTLLNIIGFLDTPSSGEYSFDNQSNLNIQSFVVQKILRNKIGYLFQNYALLENETVRKNMLIAMKYGKYKNKGDSINDALNAVGLEGMGNRKIYTLSGGEQQRVALARLIVKPCQIILADEPTGNLDEENTEIVIKLLFKMNEQGKTIIMVTHNHSLLHCFNKIINLDDYKSSIM